MRDRTAFDLLFLNNYGPLCNYANAILQDAIASEDVVQSVFEGVWNKGLKNIKEPDRYLLRAVKFRCIDWLRRQRKESVVPDSEALIKGLTDETSTREAEAEIHEKVTYLVAALPEKTRQVFLMSRQQGYTYREIAEQLEISIKTVENQMGRALRLMRAKMTDFK